jgi:hypothetical protein
MRGQLGSVGGRCGRTECQGGMSFTTSEATRTGSAVDHKALSSREVGRRSGHVAPAWTLEVARSSLHLLTRTGICALASRCMPGLDGARLGATGAPYRALAPGLDLNVAYRRKASGDVARRVGRSRQDTRPHSADGERGGHGRVRARGRNQPTEHAIASTPSCADTAMQKGRAPLHPPPLGPLNPSQPLDASKGAPGWFVPVVGRGRRVGRVQKCYSR